MLVKSKQPNLTLFLTPSGIPLVGELAGLGYDGLYVCNGMASKGMMIGPMIANILAERIVGGGELDEIWEGALVKMDPCREGGIRRVVKQ